MRIALSAGHNIYNGKYFDCGSVGNGKREADITKETVKLLIDMLKKQGHAVIDVTPYNEKFATKKEHHVLRCRRVDEFNADIYLDIHINAGGGTGVEVWVHNMNSKATPYAEKISENISKNIGIKNRGVKYKPTYWSINLTNKPAMIIEGAFIDNSLDMKKLTPEKYALAIAECFGEINRGDKMKKKEQVVSDWAKEAWNWAKKERYLDGNRPKEPITREEIAIILKRLCDKKVRDIFY